MITFSELLVHAGVTLGVMALIGMAWSGLALWRQHRGGAR